MVGLRDMKQWIMSIGALLSAIVVIFMSGKRRGKQDMEAKQNADTLEAIKNVQERIHRAGNVDGDDITRSLRKGDF